MSHYFVWCNRYCVSLEEYRFFILKVYGLNSHSSVGGFLLSASDSRAFWWQCPYCYHLSTLLNVFVVFSGTGGWRLETIKRCWKIKDMLCVWSMFLLFWSLNEILFKIIFQTCFNVLKKKTLFGVGYAWHA